MKELAFRVEYWDPKVHKVFVGPYLRKYWFLNGKKQFRSKEIFL